MLAKKLCNIDSNIASYMCDISFQTVIAKKSLSFYVYCPFCVRYFSEGPEQSQSKPKCHLCGCASFSEKNDKEIDTGKL